MKGGCCLYSFLHGPRKRQVSRQKTREQFSYRDFAGDNPSLEPPWSPYHSPWL